MIHVKVTRRRRRTNRVRKYCDYGCSYRAESAMETGGTDPLKSWCETHI